MLASHWQTAASSSWKVSRKNPADNPRVMCSLGNHVAWLLTVLTTLMTTVLTKLLFVFLFRFHFHLIAKWFYPLIVTAAILNSNCNVLHYLGLLAAVRPTVSFYNWSLSLTKFMPVKHLREFLPHCMGCRRGLAMRFLTVCPSVCQTRGL